MPSDIDKNQRPAQAHEIVTASEDKSLSVPAPEVTSRNRPPCWRCSSLRKPRANWDGWPGFR